MQGGWSVIALDNVDLKLFAGTVHCVIGENGAGKSIQVKVITGIQKADGGSVLIRNQDAVGNRKLFEKVAYVPQELDLFPDLSVAENLFLPFARTGAGRFFVTHANLVRRSRLVLERFRIGITPEKLVKNISISQQQLLQIARAHMMQDFGILIMDEPTKGIDVRTRVEIHRMMLEIAD